MNIITATNMNNKAREFRNAGNLIDAARLYLAAQRSAIQCRSGKREDLAFSSHCGAVLTADRILKTSLDNNERAEAGRIKAESNHIFRNR